VNQTDKEQISAWIQATIAKMVDYQSIQSDLKQKRNENTEIDSQIEQMQHQYSSLAVAFEQGRTA
jgi:hypothetical protein